MHKGVPVPKSRLPSLDLLKGFEAAARHLSFTRAAEELFLTQSALSRQMQTLEEQLGLPLFERRHRQLLLTDAGQLLHATAKTVLAELTQAVAAIRRDQAAQPLTVSTNQPFASLWLIPRLPRFRERHPKIDVYISADNRIVDLGHGQHQRAGRRHKSFTRRPRLRERKAAFDDPHTLPARQIQDAKARDPG